MLGTGSETRAFVSIDDFTDGLAILLERGRHREIYNIGTTEEVTIADLARKIAGRFGREIEIVPGPPAKGSTSRRCPDIAKLAALGYSPMIDLDTRAAGDGGVVSRKRAPGPADSRAFRKFADRLRTDKR